MGVQVPCRFTPKYRKKLMFGQIRRHLGTAFHEPTRRKECKIEEGHPKGKSSIWIAQNVERKLRNFLGHKFWARGVGRDEETIRTYIRNQEMADKQLDQLQLKLATS